MLLACASLSTASARADVPNGPALLRVLGPRAAAVIAPGSSGEAARIGALVTLAPGQDAVALGLEPFVPGFARLHGSSAELLTFADQHPDVHLEVAPPLHRLLSQAGVWTGSFAARREQMLDGTGVLVGVADTGLDVTHPDLRDPTTGHSRVAWMLDLSLKPAGLYPELEQKFGITDSNGNLVLGAVLQGSDIDTLVANKSPLAPVDEVGHGTHVTSIAAGNGGGGPYIGVAPNAGLVIARVTRDASDTIENDDMIDGVSFLFDRADAMGKPIAVNLSLGSDFGPHDGTTAWEQALAAFVGPGQPGHAIAVAAGNSGSIAEPPLVHQNIFVTKGSEGRVTVTTQGAENGQVQIWVSMQSGAQVSVGLDGPDGQWIAPVSSGNQNAKNTSAYAAGVINGSSVPGSPVPATSQGAVVVWSGEWPAGNYAVTLEGEGTVDLFLQATGDAAGADGAAAGFLYGVRQGTINLPATEPSLLAVGCTVNRTGWTTIDGAMVGLGVPLLDGPGGLPADGLPVSAPVTGDAGAPANLVNGEICWFSSAGPTVTGVPKPEIAAPGGIVVAAMSQQALPGQPNSIFTNPSCPPLPNSKVSDARCLQVDADHAVAVGTSMAAPQAAGAAALLFERDPTLTQDQIVALLQAGVHYFRSGPQAFEDQGGPGELDVLGALSALEQTNDPAMYLPDSCTPLACHNWLTVSSDFAAADGSLPVEAILELRTSDGAHHADLFEASRLQPIANVDGVPLVPAPTLTRKAPGLWFFTVTLPPGFGGSNLTLGATFDGIDAVSPKTIPIATDTWTADYPTEAAGSCRAARGNPSEPLVAVGAVLASMAVLRRRRRATRWRG